MGSGGFRFARFHLDMGERRLWRDDMPVEMNSRYLDALALLVREQGKLVTKGRFLEEVWRDVPVTDEALTQCIKTLRRQLGDNAADPCFIETVPKHGYRFIAPVEEAGTAAPPTPLVDALPPPGPGGPPSVSPAAMPTAWRRFLLLGLGGTAGAAVSGAVGGLLYGFAATSGTAGPGMGAFSVLLVLACITLFIALLGGAGVSFGIAAVGLVPGSPRGWGIAGGAAGGLLVGAVVKLLGLDAFTLLFGQSPGDITGAAEGLVLGAAVGLGAWIAGRGTGGLRRGAIAGALCGGMAGALVTLLGGRLLGGSLDLLAQRFPEARLRLDPIGALLGEAGFGPVSQTVTATLEGALFAACTVAALSLARRRMEE
ncbi:transcriptional regulator [Aerophototrophica crusticola]|uniref:Transcriptional regulator n=1 Tax=Aerophototrophica crusticola TaxID=1709002 RepID=A0A858RAM2_9PROT|nr:transcriptional regulator [Rhodospirillaceae bacterium B3]